MTDLLYTDLAKLIQTWGVDLGFQQIGITDTEPGKHEHHLKRWLEQGFQGEMKYMSQHGIKRSRPAELIPGTLRVISVRMDYLPRDDKILETLGARQIGYVSRYALGRDYHKVLRSRLKKLEDKIESFLVDHGIEGFAARVFTDSAPVLEKALAEKSGLGWIGKNTLLLNKEAGSWFFLGEIFTNIPLPINQHEVTNRCGSCRACMDICPTHAIVAPYQLDARLCISYQTIENRGDIPEKLRSLMGNRIFGCDDCQVVCPWNRYASATGEGDFSPRHGLEDSELLQLFAWSEDEFLKKTEGSAIRRTGYSGWLRNISVALGNADYDPSILTALEQKLDKVNEMVAGHIEWAIIQQRAKFTQTT
ncbi:MAG: tRNA epoxyqueuosine(34) reductase QueG [Gammaproteobacteria bacterium]|nr:tRNA epoxyqueuosine(34) reductase QueG [Gammaproteobacteria bacterium]